jgi:hypothetical protein
MKRAILLILCLGTICGAHTVKTVNPGGGADYTSLYDANEALPNPLGDDYEISCAGATNDTTPVLVAVNMGGHTLRIHGNCTSGTFDDSKYQIALAGANTTAITVTSPTTGLTIDHVQFAGYVSGGSRSYDAIMVSTANNVTVHDCLFQDFNQGGSGNAIYFYTGGTTGRIAYNNIVWNCTTGGQVWQSQGTFYNNTFVNCTVNGIHIQEVEATNALIKNNLVKGSTTADYARTVSGSGTVVTAKNFTGDTTSPDAGCGSATITFVGGEDFHLHASMNQTMQGEAQTPTFTTDIDGATRAWWDPGADEVSNAPAGLGPILIQLYSEE